MARRTAIALVALDAALVAGVLLEFVGVLHWTPEPKHYVASPAVLLRLLAFVSIIVSTTFYFTRRRWFFLAYYVQFLFRFALLLPTFWIIPAAWRLVANVESPRWVWSLVMALEACRLVVTVLVQRALEDQAAAKVQE